MQASHPSVPPGTSPLIHRWVTLAAIVQSAALTPVLPFITMKVDSTVSAAVILGLGLYLTMRAGREVGSTRLDVPVVGFLGVCGLATLASANPFISYFPSVSRGDGLLVYFAYGAVALMAARLARTDVSALIVSLLGAGVVISAVALLQYYGLDATHAFKDKVLPFDRSWGTLGNPIFLGGYLSLVFPLALTLTLYAPGPQWPWYAAASAVLYGALVASETRAAWLACAAAVVLLMRFLPDAGRLRRRWAVLAVVGAAVTAAMIVTQEHAHLAQRALSTIDPQDVSLQSRLFVWKSVVPLIVRRPLLGWGFSALAGQHPGMTTPGYFRMVGDAAVDGVHNELLHITFATGLAGLAAYLWIWGRVLRSLRPSTPTHGAGGEVTLGLAASMSAYFIWLQTGWSVVGPANVFWALAGAAVAWSHSSGAQAEGRPGLATGPQMRSPLRKPFPHGEPILAAMVCAALIIAATPAYRAARQAVADEERVQDAEGWHTLHHTAEQEMREIAARWRALAWACFRRTADTRRCADNAAVRFYEASVNWQVDAPAYVTTPTSITMIVDGKAGSPLAAEERYTVTLSTRDGTARDEFGAK